MKQGTMNILFFVLKTKLLKNGEAPVLMRITINGDYDDARIQRSVPLNLWNAAKGCSKGRDRASVALNTYIAELHARALEKHKELVLEQALITPKLILKRVFGKDTGMRTLLGTMQEGIEEMESLIEKFKILRFERDPKQKDRIFLDIHLTPYFPAKSFVIKLEGTKGDDENDWNSDYAQDA